MQHVARRGTGVRRVLGLALLACGCAASGGEGSAAREVAQGEPEAEIAATATPVASMATPARSPVDDGNQDLGSDQGEFPWAGALERDPSFNPQGKRLTQAQRGALADKVLFYNQTLAWFRRNEVGNAIDDHVQALIVAGEYSTSDVGCPLSVGSSRTGNVVAGRNGYGVEFDATQVPEIVAVRRELDEMRAGFRAEIVRYFESLPEAR